MQSTTFIFAFVTVLLAIECGAAPFSLTDIFPGFVGNTKLLSPGNKKDEPVKRQVAANPDGELKQISLNGLIGDLENSFFQSAMSVNQMNSAGSVVDEIRPASPVDQHEINKREPATDKYVAGSKPEAAIDATTDLSAEGRKVLIQTTKKVPETDGQPAHILIDRVAVQPHTGGVPLVPTFQVHHTKLVSATIKEDKANPNADTQTKISITKTSITSTADTAPVTSTTTTITVGGKETPSSAATAQTAAAAAAAADVAAVEEPAKAVEAVSASTTDISSTTGSSTVAAKSEVSSTTAKEPVEKIKEAEEHLKEKVAEIEAEPIILSSRV